MKELKSNIRNAFGFILCIFCFSSRVSANCTPPASCIYNWWPAEFNTTDIVSGDNGTLENGAGYAPGIVGEAFSLTNSASGYVQVPHDNVWGFGTNDFTIEMWVNFRTWNPSGSFWDPDAIFIGDDDASMDHNKWFFAIHSNPSVLTFHINSPTLGPIWLDMGAFTPVTNQWYHLAVTREGNLFTIYTNGEVAGSTTYTVTIPNPSAPLTIGQAEGLGYINGLIDEPSIYRCALSQSEIQAIYNAGSSGKCPLCVPPPSCIYNWWPAESNADDIVSADNGTLENGAGFASGIVGEAFDLHSSSDDYIQVPHDNVWGFGTNDFTIEMWANFRTHVTNSYIYNPEAIFMGDDNGAGNQDKWMFMIDQGKLCFHINSPTLGPVFLESAPFNLNTNTWYHLAVVRSQDTFTFYTNGVSAGSINHSVDIPNPSAPLTIGEAEGISYFNGLLDEISVYRCALSPAEIQAIYNAGSSGKCK